LQEAWRAAIRQAADSLSRLPRARLFVGAGLAAMLVLAALVALARLGARP